MRRRVREEGQHTSVASRKARCTSCNRVKVKCSGDSLPCARCFQLCLACVPASTDTTYPELAVSLLNIAETNQAFMTIFERALTAGMLGGDSIRILASAWRAESERAGMDVTHGLLHMFTCATQLSSAELSSSMVDIGHADGGLPKRGGADAGCVCVPRPVRCGGGTVVFSMGTELRRERAVATHGVASQEAALRAHLSESGIYAEDDGSRMVVAVSMTREGLVVAMNSAAEELFCSATELKTLMHRYGVLPMHVLASMIPSEERHLLYEAEVSVLCSQPRPFTAFLKLCERDGQVELYILHARALRLPEMPEACGLATVFTLERCPASRHVTTRPGHRHRLIERHRRVRRGGLNSQQSGSLRPHVTVLPFACLPLTPPSRTDRQWTDASRCDYPSTPPPLPITTIAQHPQDCLDTRRNGMLLFPTAERGSHLPRGTLAPVMLGCGMHASSGHDLGEGVKGYDGQTSGLARSAREGRDRHSCLRETLSPLGSLSEESDVTGSSGEGDDLEDQWLEEFLRCWGSQQSGAGAVVESTKPYGMHAHESIDGVATANAHPGCMAHGSPPSSQAHIQSFEGCGHALAHRGKGDAVTSQDVLEWLRHDPVPMSLLIIEVNSR